MKLVIVDDIATNRKLLRVTLEAEGHTTLEAADGMEALEILAREQVDGVVSDILMPRMDGYRLCHEIRADKRLRDLPIVIYTSTYTAEADEKLAIELGADKYLTKPASVEKILAALQEALGRKHSAPRGGALLQADVLREYSDRLVTKLEERNIELERQIRMAALSMDVGAALAHGETLPEVLQRCANALVQHLGAAYAGIWTHTRTENAMELRASAEVCRSANGNGGMPVGRFKIDTIARGRKPFLTNSMLEESGIAGQEWIRHEGLVAFAGYPLIADGYLLGVLAVLARDPLEQATLERLGSVADAVALGIERKWAEQELRRGVFEKTILLKEVHHRVKNNLQVICSLLSMQLACADESAARPLNDAHSRVLAMSLIHEQIYQSDTLTDLDFGEYIRLLAGGLFAAYCVDQSRVRLELSVEPIHLVMSQAIPCGLILNELLSNALKHAFSDGRLGVIRITVRNTGNGCAELSVSDDGIGLPADFSMAVSRSLGLTVVSTLILQLRADLTVTGVGGASFVFVWKLAGAESTGIPPPVIMHPHVRELTAPQVATQ